MSATMADRSKEWTLTEAARLLGEPQHRLIYLCEKGVVQPDIQDAKGRGSSRRFSARNLLEFAVALRLRDLEIAVSFVGAILYAVRAFEGSVAKRIPGFKLPESLRDPRAPDFRVVIGDGARLYFTLALAGSAPKVYGGIDLREVASTEWGPRDLDRALARAKAPERGATPGGVDGPEGSRAVRLEVSVTEISRELELET
jgi:DNA-binding transcriptional MerR regulator